MGLEREAKWRTRLLAACDRALAKLSTRNDPGTHKLRADVQALRNRLQQQVSAERDSGAERS